ncbi:hypothetical protein ACNITM_18155 [Escherichia coli]
MTAVFIKIDTRSLVAYMSTDSSIKKTSESDKENESVVDSVKNTMEYVIKDKVFNKLFAYIFISFLVVNWRDILILLKSKEDVLYTLSIVFTGEKIQFLDGEILPPWFAHFFLPFFYGVIASIVAPVITLAVSCITTKVYYKIKILDNKTDENEKEKLAKRAKKRAEREIEASYSQQKLDERKKELEDILNKIEDEKEKYDIMKERFDDAITLTYKNIHILPTLYENRKCKIETPQDLYDFIAAIKKTSFYSTDFNELFSDISRLYSEMQTDLSEK